MKSIKEIKSILSAHKNVYYKKYGVKRLGIFGSYCRGEQSTDSDIDIYVEFNYPIGLEFIDLAEDIEKLLNAKVDLISKGAIKTKNWKFIKEDLVYV